MTEKKISEERTELYEREMKHEEHRKTPLDTAGRDAEKRERIVDAERSEGSEHVEEEGK